MQESEGVHVWSGPRGLDGSLESDKTDKIDKESSRNDAAVGWGGNAERWSQSEQPHDRCIGCIIKEAKAYEIDVGLVEIEYPYWQFLNWAATEVKSNEYLSFMPRATLSPRNLKREGMD